MTASLRLGLSEFADCSWLASTGSTNADLMFMARNRGAQARWPRLLGAHQQTSGKGRLGRTWHNVPGQALMFSCGFELPWPHSSPQALRGLGPAIGYASACSIASRMDQSDRLSVKWPNDLMLGDGKLGGILIETNIKANAQFVIIGLGLNLAGHEDLSLELNREVAALDDGVDDYADLVASLAHTWHDTLHQSVLAGFMPFHQDFQSRDYLAGRTVDLWHQQSVLASGVACGLAEDGSLQIRTVDGIKAFNAGDISVGLHSG